MRCTCCNRNLSDYESTLRRADNNEFVDICLKCLKDIPIATVGREDLNPFEDPFDEADRLYYETHEDDDEAF